MKSIHKTTRGTAILGSVEEFMSSNRAKTIKKKVQLIFTSPPFPLNRKKKYGNYTGEEYKNWLSGLAIDFKKLLKPNGSIVIEVGNSWVSGKPIMSTLAIESLLNFLEAGNFNLCQQFICYNPARLPTPAQWVNIDRIRVKDSFTHVWWMSSSDRPKADNRKVLNEYSDSMKQLLSSKKYNYGKRPSGHNIGKTSFLKNNNGSIPSNVIILPNTQSNSIYQSYCKGKNLTIHPARMQPELAEFFIKFLTSPKELVFDPFAGSNTTGFVAEKLKRRWLSVEVNEEYIKGSIGRFKEF